MTETQLIERALSHCGYESEPTEESLIECFLDYVDSGVFGDMDVEEAKDLIEDNLITVKSICLNLLKLK